MLTSKKSRKIIKLIMVALVTTLYLAPVFALAQTPQLPNPLGKQDLTLADIMLRVVQISLGAVDIFALFMFILGGFELMTSRGNPDMVKKGKDTIVWATLGILVITLSYIILKFVFESLTSVTK